MTDREKILKAIEQKRQAIRSTDTGEMKPATVPNNLELGWLNALKWIEDLINSLPAEQPSEELEKAAKDFVEKNSPYTDEFMLDNEVEEAYKIAELTFKRGAQWQKEQIINKACEWLNKNIVECHPRTGKLRPIVNINAFREAMEDEQ